MCDAELNSENEEIVEICLIKLSNSKDKQKQKDVVDKFKVCKKCFNEKIKEYIIEDTKKIEKC